MMRELKHMLRPHIAKNAGRIALIVGTLLNVINQGEPFIKGIAISWPHVFLNYLVPFCVASYSAYKNEQLRVGHKENSPLR